MSDIEPPDADLHRLIREIIELKEAGRIKEAEARYQEVAPLSEKIIGLLESVERKIQTAA